MAPKRPKSMSMEELIPPSPVKKKKGQSQARSAKHVSASGQYKRPRSNASQIQQEAQSVTPTIAQSETHQQVPEASQEEPVTTQLHESGQMNGGVKKGRGAACGMADWGSGKIAHIEFDTYWKPIGENANGFVSQLGILARDGVKVPLTFTSWSGMSDEALDGIWKDVKDNTDVPDEYKHHCLKAVGKLWKDWKSRVKTKWYDKYETDEQRLAITPNRVVAEQWKILVKYWGLPEVQEMCEVNKSSRADGGVAPHRTGRTSFAQKRKESVQGSSLGLNQPCNILSWLDNNEVVAKGRVSVVDPSTRVHGHMLGPDRYRVEIEEALNPRAEFYRFQPEFSAMEDAVGSMIAWPIKYIAPRT